MRADRLISMLMLLQARGKITAEELAVELGVSERTIYRDIEALSFAGVPVYAERGPGGGIGLLEPYRTSLTGLKAVEAQALSMLNIPAPLLDLGVGEPLKAALLKLSAALPAEGMTARQAAHERILLDATWWGQSAKAGPYLQILQQAVMEDRRLGITNRVHYRLEIEHEVEPLGLAAKTNQWYLVALRQGRPQAYRTTDLAKVELLDETFTRPADFDLADFWRGYCGEVEAQRSAYWVTARISPQLAGDFHWFMGEAAEGILAEAGEADAQGWLTVRMSFESESQARERLLGMGGAAEVIAPVALRKSVVDFAAQVLSRYGEGQAE